MPGLPELRELVAQRLGAAVRGAVLYSLAHPVTSRALQALTEAVTALLQRAPKVTLGCVGDDLVVDDARLRSGTVLAGLVRTMREQEVDKITIEAGATASDLTGLVEALARAEPGLTSVEDFLRTLGVRCISVGRIALDDAPTDAMGVAAALKVYHAAVGTAEQLWNMTKAGEQPDPRAARTLIDALARVSSQDSTSLMALTTLKKQDSYTFTHMVNVSVLTLAQARSLRLSPALQREFGLAALMHDIGKINTPIEILNKPDNLTREEFDIMKRHVVDGANILRRTPEMPALAPVVAFEHHLRLDLNGYPEHAIPRELNLCTLLVTVADVFDALRSKRAYRDQLPTSRVKAIMAEPSGVFHPTLLRRFVNLVGMYPVGTLVMMNTGEIGVVTREHPLDPFRPQVKIAFDADGAPLAERRLVNTWERNERGDHPWAIVDSADPDVVGVDPLTLL